MKVIVIDLETGGLDPQRHAITGASAIYGEILFDGFQYFRPIDFCSNFICPHPGWDYQFEALEYQGTTITQLRGHGVFLEDFQFNFNMMMDRNGLYGVDSMPESAYPPIWAQKADFDYDFLRRERIRYQDQLYILTESSRTTFNCSRQYATIANSLGLIKTQSVSQEKLYEEFFRGNQEGYWAHILNREYQSKSLRDCYQTGCNIAKLTRIFREWGSF